MDEPRPVLLTVSGSIPQDLDEQVAAGRRPRADYRMIAEQCHGDVVDVETAQAESGRAGRLVYRFGGAGPLLAWYAFRRRRRYDVLLTDGEQVGIPLALLTRVFGKRGSVHVMIVHVVSVPKKMRLIRGARLARHIDRYVTYSSRQSEIIRDQLHVPEANIVMSTFMVDTQFFASEQVAGERRRLICSAGLERRDYPTLMEAVTGLDVDVVIAAASPWSKQADSSAGRSLPSNVTVRRFDLYELRQLYFDSLFVVMPLVEVDFQAGITTILEAMSMGRAVVCTRTPGQTDTVIDGETGLYVCPGDASSLRSAIEQLLVDTSEAERLGSNGREWVVEHADIEKYARFLARVAAGAREPRDAVS